MRSVDLYSFYIAYASVTERNGDRLFLRNPANARDVPAGPLVAPQSQEVESSPTSWSIRRTETTTIARRAHRHLRTLVPSTTVTTAAADIALATAEP